MIRHRTLRDSGPEMSALETKLRNAEWTLFQAKGFGASDEKLKPLQEQVAALRAQMDRPKVVRKPSTKPKERDILKAIMELLHRHPKVATVARFNSGVFQKQYGDKTHYIRANTQKGMADIQGMLKGGTLYAFEVKSPTGIVAAHQEAYLKTVRDNGGIGEVVRSVDDVISILGRA